MGCQPTHCGRRYIFAVTGMVCMSYVNYKQKIFFSYYFRFPFHLNTKWRFVAAYIYQIVGVYTSAIMNLSMDFLIVGLMSVANAYIKILGCRLANLGQFKSHQQENRNEVFEDLRRCIEFHKQVLR